MPVGELDPGKSGKAKRTERKERRGSIAVKGEGPALLRGRRRRGSLFPIQISGFLPCVPWIDRREPVSDDLSDQEKRKRQY